MSNFSPKERLSRTLRKEKVERPPVICSGGMMNAAVVDVMKSTGHTLPDGHHHAELMAKIAQDVHTHTGFENIGIPFCMTVEAEVLGAEIDFGSLNCEPKIAKENFSSVRSVQYKDIKKLIKEGRIEAVANASYILSKECPDIPVIGSITGPVSTAASIVDPITFLKELRKDVENAHRVLDYVSDFLVLYAQALLESGADVICIGDPTATGEILGPKMFSEYAVRYLNKVIDGIHALNKPVIVHICGNMKSVKNYIPEIKADAISTDALVNLRQLKEEFPTLTTMGNLSTFLLEFGDAEGVIKQTKRLLQDGIDIISPACGLSTSTSLQNIIAMTTAVKES